MHQIIALIQKCYIFKQAVSLLDETSRNVEFWSEASTLLTLKRDSSRCCFALGDIEALKSKCYHEVDVSYRPQLTFILFNEDRLNHSFFYKLIMKLFNFILVLRLSIDNFEGAIRLGAFREMAALGMSGKVGIDKAGIPKCSTFFNNDTLFYEIEKIVSQHCETVLNAYDLFIYKLFYQVFSLNGVLKF
jgi:hypothetical protein